MTSGWGFRTPSGLAGLGQLGQPPGHVTGIAGHAQPQHPQPVLAERLGAAGRLGPGLAAAHRQHLYDVADLDHIRLLGREVLPQLI